MPVGIMTSKAQKSDRAPPIGVSLPSFLHQSPRKCLCVCVWGSTGGERLAPGSIWSWTSLHLAAAQMDK